MLLLFKDHFQLFFNFSIYKCACHDFILSSCVTFWVMLHLVRICPGRASKITIYGMCAKNAFAFFCRPEEFWLPRSFHLFCSLMCLLQRLSDVSCILEFLFPRPFSHVSIPQAFCNSYSQLICLLQKPVYLQSL